MNSNNYNPGIDSCFWCPEPSEEPDHIPPKDLFPADQRGLVPWVPSCASCNRGWSKDDELFISVVRLTCSEHGLVADKIEDKVSQDQARLEHTGKPGVTGRIKQMQSKFSGIRTKSGLWIPPQDAFKLEGEDKERCCQIFARIVRGFSYKFLGSRLPADTRVSGFTIVQKMTQPEEFNASWSWTEIIPGQLSFQVVNPYGDDKALWFLKFFEESIFYAAVVPKQLSERFRLEAKWQRGEESHDY